MAAAGETKWRKDLHMEDWQGGAASRTSAPPRNQAYLIIGTSDFRHNPSGLFLARVVLALDLALSYPCHTHTVSRSS